MSYRVIQASLLEKWCPLPGLLVVIKGPKDSSEERYSGNSHQIDGLGNWVWIPESFTEEPVLLLGFCNPWCMRVMSRNGIFDTHLDNLKFVLCCNEQEFTKK